MNRNRLALVGAGIALTSGTAQAQLEPDWIGTVPVGTSLSAGLQGMVVDDAGNSYITGTGGSSGNTDVITAAFDPQGNLLWMQAFNGPEDWHDQGRGICLAPGGVVYVCGNTPDPMSYANVLVIKYDRATGEQLGVIDYTTGPGTSEFGGSIVADAEGNIYVGGGTVGDGSDGLLLSFTSEGELRWITTYDGPAFAPYSQDHFQQLMLAPDGSLVARVYGVTNSLHPDYIAHKYDTSDGSLIWEATWGFNGGEEATDMVIDDAGDVYLTGVGLDFTDQFSTVKFRGTDGALLWQKYDSAGADDIAWGVALDDAGGVYITGSADPDGDHSNFNDNFLTVKRDAATGSPIWEHHYGANCVGCYDVPADVIVASGGHTLVVGRTSSPPYSADMILFDLDSESGKEIDRGVVSGDGPLSVSGAILALDASEDIFVGGGAYNANTGDVSMAVTKFPSLQPECAADCDGNGALNILDFLCYQGMFQNGDPGADCNGDATMDILDFICFSNEFEAGCP